MRHIIDYLEAQQGDQEQALRDMRAYRDLYGV
jgi:hypothetical protein